MSVPFETFGKYVLLEKLATGGMAEVFLARGTGTAGIGKFFAIKRILPQYADSPEFIEMFKEEAKIAINLNHSNIVSIHEFGVEKGQFFLVMDYVEGRNLRQILNKMKKSSLQFSIDQIIYVIKEVGTGLDHAHRCIDGSTGKPLNITHRDMSPQNIMVSFEGETKIVDFGIAKAESQIETTRAGTLKGKFGYMSPEQAEGQPVDLRTDIFSLGIVLWELLANDRLFVANNEINTLRKIRDCQIPSLRKINPNIHTELERIVQKALARDRNLRYQTGAALHRDLNRFLNRQYPDFSPQDFSVFIKSVFADEILSLRKRLVDYAKMNLTVGTVNPRASSNFDDRTSLLDTHTNSLVVSESGVVVSEAGIKIERESTPTPVTNTAQDATTVTPAETGPSIDMSQAGTRTDHNTLPIPRTATTGLVLDEKALAAESQRDVATKGKAVALETEDIGNQGLPPSRTYANRPRPRAPSDAHRATPVRFATFIVFALLCTSAYAYLVKYFTPMMSEVIVTTDPYLHEFHVALGVDPQTTNIASHGDPRGLAGQPQPAPAAAAHPTPPKVSELETLKTVEDDPATLSPALVVISNPSGAEILLNDKGTGLVTPSRIDVPIKGTFSITLRKHGYADVKAIDVTKAKMGNRYTANLAKMNVAYVNVDVFPPQDATIYVNGKALTLRAPIRDLPVSANVPVKIRAEAKGGGTDEVVLNLPVDRRQSIQLNPRKSTRVPSNSDEE